MLRTVVGLQDLSWMWADMLMLALWFRQAAAPQNSRSLLQVDIGFHQQKSSMEMSGGLALLCSTTFGSQLCWCTQKAGSSLWRGSSTVSTVWATSSFGWNTQDKIHNGRSWQKSWKPANCITLHSWCQQKFQIATLDSSNFHLNCQIKLTENTVTILKWIIMSKTKLLL